MKILLISENQQSIEIAKQTAKIYNYKLKCVRYDEIDKYIDKTLHTSTILKHIFKISYDVIILDNTSLYALNSIFTVNGIAFNPDDIILHPIMLLVDDFSQLDVNMALKLRIFTMISQPLNSEKLNAYLLMSIEKFRINQKASEWAFKDSLTNVYNRRTFYQYLSKHFDEFKMLSKNSFCVAILDIDHFKFINDTFGHNAGDHVLKIFADTMKARTRSSDVLARIGGEEFAIVFPGTSRNLAYKILERIRESMLESNELEEHLKITFSAGLVEVGPNVFTPEDLLGLADLLLYKAKDLGRDKICF